MESTIDFSKDANESVYFNDGRMAPKNDSKSYLVLKRIFIGVIIAIILLSILFKEFILAEISFPAMLCFVIFLGYICKNGGHERIECSSELHFYNDYMIFYVPKHHIKVEHDQMEIQKIYYKDITKCQFRTNIRKVEIYGMLDETHYKYNKQGVRNNTPSYQKRYDGMIKFYTVFDYQHDFVEILERNTGIKVKLEES